MDHDHLIGRTITATLTGQGTTITGTLRPDRTAHVHVIDLGDGTEVMVHPDQTNIEEVTSPPSASGRRHLLADHMDTITDSDWAHSRAIHEAAHAVIGMIASLSLEEVWVGTGQSTRVGGQARFAPGNPQALAVHLTAGPEAQRRCVAALGYGSLVQAAVEVLAGQGDHATILTRIGEGHVIWPAQANRDAQTLLSTPAVWAAIQEVSDALLKQGSLDGSAVQEMIGDPGGLAEHQIWIPNL